MCCKTALQRLCWSINEANDSVTVGDTGGRRRASLVWNEAFAAGKAFPVRKVPIEVWSLGRFKFKGIAGTCKASAAALQELPLIVVSACCNTSCATCCISLLYCLASTFHPTADMALSTVSLLVLFEQARTLLDNRNKNLLMRAAIYTMCLNHLGCGQLSAASYQQSTCTVRQGFVGLLQVMQVYPAELAGRMQLHDYQLNAGKATLVSQGHASCQYQTEINLLDVFQLPMSTT